MALSDKEREQARKRQAKRRAELKRRGFRAKTRGSLETLRNNVRRRPRATTGGAKNVVHKVRQLGVPLSDPSAVNQALKQLYGADGSQAASKALKRALPRVLQLDRWASLTLQWAGQKWDATPKAALEFVHGFIDDAGPDRTSHNIPKIYDFLEAQPWSWNSRKFKRLQDYRREMRNDPSYRPTLALWSKRKTDVLISKILELMRADPAHKWMSFELAHKLRVPRHTMRYVTRMMCDGIRPPLLSRRGARGPFVLYQPDLQAQKPSSWRAIQMFVDAGEGLGLRFMDLKLELGDGVVSALRTLRINGLASPSDERRKAPIYLTPKAWSEIKSHGRIRNRTGVILWAREGALEPTVTPVTPSVTRTVTPSVTPSRQRKREKAASDLAF